MRMHSHTLRGVLGLKSGGHLPDEGRGPVNVQGVLVYVAPRLGLGRRAHRVIAICPKCNVHLSAGRYFADQHRCVDALRRAINRLPPTFGLRDWPGKTFRVNVESSYTSPDYGPQIVVQVNNGTADAPLWQDFVRSDAKHVLDQHIPL